MSSVNREQLSEGASRSWAGSKRAEKVEELRFMHQ